MRSTLTATALALLSLTVIAVAQNQPLKFEVATVKTRHTNGGGVEMACYFPGVRVEFVAKGTCMAKNARLRDLIVLAYSIRTPTAEHLIGGPAWIGSDRFDIQGKAANVSASNDELRVMLRNLLFERFKLQVHEQKSLEQPGLRLQQEKLPVVRIVIDHAEKPDAN